MSRVPHPAPVPSVVPDPALLPGGNGVSPSASLLPPSLYNPTPDPAVLMDLTDIDFEYDSEDSEEGDSPTANADYEDTILMKGVARLLKDAKTGMVRELAMKSFQRIWSSTKGYKEARIVGEGGRSSSLYGLVTFSTPGAAAEALLRSKGSGLHVSMYGVEEMLDYANTEQLLQSRVEPYCDNAVRDAWSAQATEKLGGFLRLLLVAKALQQKEEEEARRKSEAEEAKRREEEEAKERRDRDAREAMLAKLSLQQKQRREADVEATENHQLRQLLQRRWRSAEGDAAEASRSEKRPASTDPPAKRMKMTVPPNLPMSTLEPPPPPNGDDILSCVRSAAKNRAVATTSTSMLPDPALLLTLCNPDLIQSTFDEKLLLELQQQHIQDALKAFQEEDPDRPPPPPPTPPASQPPSAVPSSPGPPSLQDTPASNVDSSSKQKADTQPA